MNILVVGNGFDIAHGLPTKYTDFMEFLKEYRRGILLVTECGLASRDSQEYKKILDESDNKVHELVSKLLFSDYFGDNQNIRTIDAGSFTNFWFHYFTEIQLEGENWIDFEKEISNVINPLIDSNFDKIKEHFRRLEEGITEYRKVQNGPHTINEPFKDQNDIRYNYHIKYNDIVNNLDITKLTEKLEDDLNSFIKTLEIYLRDFVMKIKIPKNMFKLDDAFDAVISFNYTNTFQNNYSFRDTNNNKNFLSYSILDDRKCDFIHGRIGNEPCNLVLGIEENFDKNGSDKHTNFIQFKKYFQRIIKETDCNYLTWLRFIAQTPAKSYPISSAIEQKEQELNMDSHYKLPETSVHTVCFFGHSLDITDKDIILRLISSNVNIIIYYHDKKAYAKSIENLVKLIGFTELNELVSGPNKKIFFVDQTTIANLSEKELHPQ